LQKQRNSNGVLPQIHQHDKLITATKKLHHQL